MSKQINIKENLNSPTKISLPLLPKAVLNIKPDNVKFLEIREQK